MCLLVRHYDDDDDDDDDDGPQYGLTLSQWWNKKIPNCFIQCTSSLRRIYVIIFAKSNMPPPHLKCA